MRLLFVALVALLLPGCFLDLVGAPCSSDDNCPKEQSCDPTGRCQGPARRIQRLEIVPREATLRRGATLGLQALATYSDGATEDVTARAVWTSASPTTVLIDDADKRGTATGVSLGIAEIAASLSGRQAFASVTVTDAALMQLVVSLPAAQLAKGQRLQTTAAGFYSDSSSRDLTSLVVWSSSAPEKAAVSNDAASRGVITGLGLGPATITASLGGVSASTSVFVTGPVLTSVGLTPTNPAIAAGTSVQFVATGTYSDQTTLDISSLVIWKTSNAPVASISNTAGSKGLANGLTSGATIISGELDGFSGSTALAVNSASLTTIALSPAAPVIATDTQVQLIAVGSFSDGSTQDLTSSVVWASSSTAVATVSNSPGARGIATGVSVGSTTLSATMGGVVGQATLRVTSATVLSVAIAPTNPSIARTTTLQLAAVAQLSDGTSQDVTASATWSSSNPPVATVSAAGLSTGISAGVATVSATVQGVTGSTSLTVTAATLSSVAVTPSNPTLGKGTTLQMAATGTYSDQSTQDLTSLSTWASSDSAVATVSNATGTTGLVAAVAPGFANISATYGGITGGTPVTVGSGTLSTLSVTPTSATIARGTNKAFSAVGTYSDGSMQDLTQTVTWSSSAIAVATVSNAPGSKGVATAVDPGACSISAQLSGRTASAALTVTAATLQSLAIVPANPSVPRGTSRQLAAVGTFSDGSTQELTTAVTWASSVPAVATVSNAVGSQGLASASTAGTTTVSASVSGVSGATGLTVTAATLTALTLSPQDSTVARSATQQFTAMGSYSDGSSQPLTQAVTWSSSNPAVATISNAAGSKGRATATGAGTTTISATSGTVSGQTFLTVNP